MLHVTQLSKHGVRSLNEDTVLVDETRTLFGIFDGASSLVPYVSQEGKTGAYIASHLAAKAFKESRQDLLSTIALANQAINAAHNEAKIDVRQNVNRFSTTAAVVRVHQDSAELLQIGDSVIILIYKDGTTNLPLGYHDHDLEVMKKWRKLADKGTKNIRQIVADDVIELRESSNVTYGTLNGDETVKQFSQTATIPLEGVATILILSDGMFIPKSDPTEPEDWDYCAELYQKGGLNKIYETVRKLEKSDPNLVKYPRYKLHDDASGIAIGLN